MFYFHGDVLKNKNKNDDKLNSNQEILKPALTGGWVGVMAPQGSGAAAAPIGEERSPGGEQLTLLYF